ncbi:hypothetical protein NW801_13680 [Brevibacillus laterosporus]|uniref:LPXTG cell wall anchor domain-containing protein n=1 Tax=Brevibacillus halotolerans TaxID=1507437 RepID=A0ABT4HYC9_9BACL|nr:MULTISPECIES: hypothetical protein [Brevibacillus]MCR8986074.1 hypothetical protein [Brevibacillus laterosporus]MCZ0831807.1 hypothetical protein [Brevibacillus halotolerans]
MDLVLEVLNYTKISMQMVMSTVPSWLLMLGISGILLFVGVKMKNRFG